MSFLLLLLLFFFICCCVLPCWSAIEAFDSQKPLYFSVSLGLSSSIFIVFMLCTVMLTVLIPTILKNLIYKVVHSTTLKTQ